MKKLISMLALVLVLALACGIALAGTDSTEAWSWKWLDANTLLTQRADEEHQFTVAPNNANVVKWPVENATTLTNGLIRFECNLHGGTDYTAAEFQEFIVFAEHDFWDVGTAMANGVDEKGNVIKGNKYVKEYKPNSTADGGYIVVYCKHYMNDEATVEYDPDLHRFTSSGKACAATQKIELKHNWSDEQDWPDEDRYITVVPPTCTEAGVLKGYCINPGCTATRDVPTANPIGEHVWTWVEDQKVQQGTCLDPYTVYVDGWKCVLCGEFDPDWSTEYTMYDPQHKFGDWLKDKDASKDATCTEAGVLEEYRICTLCLEAKELRHTDLPALGHLAKDDAKNIKKITKAPTCTEEGEMQIICGRCGKEVLDTVALKVDPNNHPKGAVVKETDSREWGDHDADYNAWLICEGDFAHYYCEDCGRWFYEYFGNGIGHDYQLDAAGSGCYDLHYVCARCGWDTWEDREVPEHDWSAWVERNAIGEGGNPGYWIRQCNRCGLYQERKDWTPPTECDDVCQHNYEIIAQEEANLIHAGFKVYRCTICGDQWTEYIPKPATLNGVEGFVARCYGTILGRAATPEEIMSWADQLTAGTADAADVVAGFVNSPEFAASGNDVVETLYEAMLDREGDLEGLITWNVERAKGASNNALINGFAGSAEFAKLCADYGIEAGQVGEEPYDVKKGVAAFVNRCYMVALDRVGEPGGMSYWTDKLITKTMTPKEVATGFVKSQEFGAQEKIDAGKAAEVVTSLYNLYLGRGASAEEVAYWTAKVEAGMSLDELNNGFADSAEFATIVEGFNLIIPE